MISGDWFRGGTAGLRNLPQRLASRMATAIAFSPIDEQLSRAYSDHLSRRIPLIYCVVIIEIAALATAFRGDAPPLLTVWLPLALCIIGFVRAIHWLPQMVARRTPHQIGRDLTRMNRMGFFSTLAVVVWGVSLYRYGDEAQQSLIQLVFAASCFSTILGVGQSQGTARSVAIAAMLPLTAFLLLTDHPNAIPVAIIQISVTILLLALTEGYRRDFVTLEISRQQLARKERESTIQAENHRHDATFDPLTGALNRRALLARLEGLMLGGGKPVWLALIDLDGFKHVNDTYGHAAGDTVLTVVGERIANTVQAMAVGRLGGDEFALVLDGAVEREAVGAVLKGLADDLRQPIMHQGVILRLAASIGVSRAAGASVSEWLERSDAALYKAKAVGGGSVEFFTVTDERELARRGAATRRFNDCMLQDRLRLLYQPLIDVDSGRITGFEAFARWSPDGEQWFNPNEFLPLAQATGRTGELTRLVVARALAECRVWEQGVDLCINLSPLDVLRDGTDQALAELARDAGAPPERIVLEVTERALHGDTRQAARQLARLRDRGFRIALDDFGAGWSSLNHVRHLPLDRLKIDRDLATTLAEDPGARAIAGTIVGLAWQMGLECSIEGVETARQVETARALGIKLMQGYHFGHPGSALDAISAIDLAA